MNVAIFLLINVLNVRMYAHIYTNAHMNDIYIYIYIYIYTYNIYIYINLMIIVLRWYYNNNIKIN
jgi:hypothetical protein